MKYHLAYAPEAVEQLTDLYNYISLAASPMIAKRYTDSLVDFCETLRTFPQRGVCRDDIKQGLRTTHYKGRTVIAFFVEDETVFILGFFYGGQDYESLLQDAD